MAFKFNPFIGNFDYYESGETPDVSYYRKTGTGTIERWYTSWLTASAPTSSAMARNQLNAIPFIVSKAITLDRIGIEITGAGDVGSLVRLGIFSSANSIPSELVLDAGTINGNSASFQSITINQTLAPGLYWLVMVHNSVANITFRAYNVSGVPQIFGSPNNLGNAGNFGLYRSVFNYAALPASFDYTGFSVVTINPFIISVRLSA